MLIGDKDRKAIQDRLMVETSEFPHLTMRYNVRGVPRTVVNEETFIEGAMPEPVFLERALEALAKGKYPKS